jgi:hypothetical protein
VLTPRQLLDQLKDRSREGLAGLTVLAESAVGPPTTVYSHVKSVLRKLGVYSRQDAVTAAKRLRREGAGDKGPHPDPMNLPRRP